MTQVNVKFPEDKKPIKMNEMKPGQFAIIKGHKTLVMRTASTLKGVSEVMDFPPHENSCWTWENSEPGPTIDVFPVSEVTIIVGNNHDE